MAKAAQELMKNYVKPEKLTELASRWGGRGRGRDWEAGEALLSRCRTFVEWALGTARAG
jgi:hypothetical protein